MYQFYKKAQIDNPLGSLTGAGLGSAIGYGLTGDLVGVTTGGLIGAALGQENMPIGPGSPTYAPIAGAGLGGLLGYTLTEDRKNSVRNAILGAGLGGALGSQVMSKLPPIEEGPKGDSHTLAVLESIAVPGALGAGVGALAGYSMNESGNSALIGSILGGLSAATLAAPYPGEKPTNLLTESVLG